MRGMKSHDYHVMMQEILPLCNISQQKVVTWQLFDCFVFSKSCVQKLWIDNNGGL